MNMLSPVACDRVWIERLVDIVWTQVSLLAFHMEISVKGFLQLISDRIGTFILCQVVYVITKMNASIIIMNIG